MRIPVPGQPVRGSKSGAPIMALLDLLGRRWAMGIVWTLAESGACAFSELQRRCETISPGVLNARLKELQEALLVARCDDGYELTARGAELYGLIEPLGRWSQHWGRDVRAAHGEA